MYFCFYVLVFWLPLVLLPSAKRHVCFWQVPLFGVGPEPRSRPALKPQKPPDFVVSIWDLWNCSCSRSGQSISLWIFPEDLLYARHWARGRDQVVSKTWPCSHENHRLALLLVCLTSFFLILLVSFLLKMEPTQWSRTGLRSPCRLVCSWVSTSCPPPDIFLAFLWAPRTEILPSNLHLQWHGKSVPFGKRWVSLPVSRSRKRSETTHILKCYRKW